MQLATARRIDQTVGLDKGSDAAAYAAAIEKGQTKWTDSKGKTRSIRIDESEFVQMMKEGTLQMSV